MIIKRYLVMNMNEAMTRIRYELGSEAIIVSNRWVRQRGFLNIFKKKVLEVTAAVDQKQSTNETIIKETKREEPKQETLQQKVSENNIEKELNDLKEVVYKLIENTSEKEGKNIKQDSEYWTTILAGMELDENIINNFNTYCRERSIIPNNINRNVLYQYFEKYVDQRVKSNFDISLDINEKIWVFVGPTGVGKTTTIAKIAAREVINNGKQVGLITIDTYRIGAVEQLKTYASILGIPLEIINRKSDISKTIEKLSYCDLILIDTTGRSSFNREQLIETKNMLDELENKRNILVVSATTRNNDLKANIVNYKSIGYDYLIITKMDETKCHGSILNIFEYTEKPIWYITTGQNVPDDIVKATKENLLDFLSMEVVI